MKGEISGKNYRHTRNELKIHDSLSSTLLEILYDLTSIFRTNTVESLSCYLSHSALQDQSIEQTHVIMCGYQLTSIGRDEADREST